MRSLLVLLLAFLIIAGPATATDVVHVTKTVPQTELSQNVMCGDIPHPGLPAGSYLAVVYLSGHGNTFIDTLAQTPAGYEKIGGKDTVWYSLSPGYHDILVAKEGYINLIAHMEVCSGRVSVIYYDQEARLFAGTTKKPETETATSVPVTTVPITTVPVTTISYEQGGSLRDAFVTTLPQEGLAALSVTTEPPGAAIYIDGVWRGVSPAIIHDIPAGTHTLLLKLDGYQDVSLPVTISAGRTQSFSSTLLKSREVPSVTFVTAGTTTAKTSSTPGFGAALAVLTICSLVFLRKYIS